MDSLFYVICGPSYIELVFKKPIRCSSIAPDGSDFIITGPQPVSSTPVIFQCLTGNPNTTIIRLDLSYAVITGTYGVCLVTGSDGNTILNECGVPTPAGQSISFNSMNAVSALFTRSNSLSCNEGTVSFFHNGNNNIISWDWDFGNGSNSTVPNPTVIFTPGQYAVKLTVSNGVCTSTASQAVRISEPFKAAFEAPELICPGNTVLLVNKSSGTIDDWTWSFGNGVTSNLADPPAFRYAFTGRENWYSIRLVASNRIPGCQDTSTRLVKVLNNCFIAMPGAFTPNNDGRNDYLYPLNAIKAGNLEFRVSTGWDSWSSIPVTGQKNGMVPSTGRPRIRVFMPGCSVSPISIPVKRFLRKELRCCYDKEISWQWAVGGRQWAVGSGQSIVNRQ